MPSPKATSAGVSEGVSNRVPNELSIRLSIKLSIEFIPCDNNCQQAICGACGVKENPQATGNQFLADCSW